MQSVQSKAVVVLICVVLLGVVGCGARNARPAAIQPDAGTPSGVLAPAQQATDAAGAINATIEEQQEQVEDLGAE